MHDTQMLIGGKFVTVFPQNVAVAEPRWPMNA